jgi:predicted RNA-binding protein with PIN domain
MQKVGIHLFCIDGTNLVRGSFGYGGAQFQAQEEADSLRLVQVLEQVCGAQGGRIEVEVFFDGGSRPGLSSSSDLRVSFARELEADALILDRVRSKRYAGAGKVTVVTGDAELGAQVCDEGGRWLRVRPGTGLEEVMKSIEGRIKK